MNAIEQTVEDYLFGNIVSLTPIKNIVTVVASEATPPIFRLDPHPFADAWGMSEDRCSWVCIAPRQAHGTRLHSSVSREPTHSMLRSPAVRPPLYGQCKDTHSTLRGTPSALVSAFRVKSSLPIEINISCTPQVGRAAPHLFGAYHRPLRQPCAMLRQFQIGCCQESVGIVDSSS